MKKGLPQVNEHMVVVLSITYNQSKFIEDTLNGFAMQRTNFPFLCCIFDDASTDGEQDVLKRWIENHCNAEDVETYDHPLTFIYMAPDKNNPNCIYAIHLQKVNTWGKPEKQELLNYWRMVGKYIALCEGDDYWIDPLKLQKQVDFLEENPDYGLCYSKAKTFVQETLKWDMTIGKSICRFEELLLGNDIPTLTTLFRYSLYKEYINDIRPHQYQWKKGDYPMWLYMSHKMKIHFDDEVMCVYRVLSKSASHGDYKFMVNFIQDSYDISLFFYNKYQTSINIQQIHDAYHKMMLSLSFRYKEYNDASRYFVLIQNKSFKDYLKKITVYFWHFL